MVRLTIKCLIVNFNIITDIFPIQSKPQNIDQISALSLIHDRDVHTDYRCILVPISLLNCQLKTS